MTVSETGLFFNPLDPSYSANPVPHLAQMREHLPVQRTLGGPWALFRYADVFQILRDPKLSVDDANANMADSQRELDFVRVAEEEGLLAELEPSQSILFIDPPDHTRLRRLVSQAFTPRAIGALRPMIESLVDDAVDSMLAEGTSDVVESLAFPLPFDVIIEMLGMESGDIAQIRTWSGAMVKTLDPIISEGDMRQSLRAIKGMRALIAEVIEAKRANPGDDLLTALIDAEEDGDRLTAAELVDQVVLLFVAGHETTVNLIGTGLYELIQRPDSFERARSGLGSSEIDELLRFVSPVQFSRRIATTDLEYGGMTIPKGAFVLACLASANRDPEHWGNTADVLDLDREGSGSHVSFGSGVHYCLGASLAKLEAEVAIGRFIERCPNAAVVGEPRWNGRINLRGLDRLVVDTSRR